MNMRRCANPESYFTEIAVWKLSRKWYMDFNTYLLLSQNNTHVFGLRWMNSYTVMGLNLGCYVF